MSILRSRLYEYELEKKREETKHIEDSKLDIDFGSQIRSYVLQPYRMVKDLRTQSGDRRRGPRARRRSERADSGVSAIAEERAKAVNGEATDLHLINTDYF